MEGFDEGIVLGHYILGNGIKVNSTKIEVVVKLLIPKSKRGVRIFLGYARYYRRFTGNFTKIASPLFKLLTKIVNFIGIFHAN